jgi:hypothetical protein
LVMFRNAARFVIGLLSLTVPAGAFAQPDSFSVVQNSWLQFAAELLATNSLPGLTHSALELMVSSVTGSSVQGGHVALVSTQAWVARYSAGPTFPDYGRRVAVDPGGNVYVAGESLGNDLKYALALVKYAPDGGPLWTNGWHGPAGTDCFARFLALNSAGDVCLSCNAQSGSNSAVVTIKYRADGTPIWTNYVSAGGPFGFGLDKAGNSYVLANASEASSSQFLTLKYDPDGKTAWAKVYKATLTGADYPVALALDNAGNVFVSGSSDGLNTGLNFAVLKYAPDGTALWTNRYVDTLYGQIVEGMAVDRDGNVIVTGDAMRLSEHLYATVKYLADGTPAWTNLLQAPGYQGGAVPRVATDLEGNVLVLGGSPGANSNDADFTLVKLTQGGVPLWTNRFCEPNIGNPAPGGSAVDSAGNYYLAGSWNRGGTDDEFVIVKWAADGTLLWTNRYNGPASSDDWVLDLAVDTAGHCCVTGASIGAGTGFDFCTLKLADLVSYTPPPGFVGLDSFSFTLTDSQGLSATGVANVRVLPAGLQFDATSLSSGLASDGFHLRVVGTAGSASVVIYSSADLVTWLPILTNAPIGDSTLFIDPGATNSPHRFYRAVQIGVE